MVIKSNIIVITILGTLPFNKLEINTNKHIIPYDLLHTISNEKNKNTIEYNTMTMEEMIRVNNEKLVNSINK